MGYGDPSIAALLASLVASPKIQQGLGAVQRALPQAAGPFSGGSPQNATGASPRANSLTYAHQGGGQGSTLGSTLASLLTGGSQQQQQQQDPLAQLYQNLLNQLQTPVAQPSAIDKEDLMRQVQAAINPIYDAREQVAQNQNTRAQADVKGLYGDLAKNYADLAPEQVAQSKANQQNIADIYGQLRSNIQGNYARVSDQQADEFKQLGIESALPDVLAKQAPAVTDATTAASENQAQQQQRYMDIGDMDSTYYREGAPNAIAKGNDVSVGLLNKLQDYINTTEGERSSGIQSGYLDQLGQAQNALSQQQSAANSETNQHQQMLWQILQAQMSQKQTPLTPDSFLGQLPSQEQQNVGAAFTQLQRSPESVYGKVADPRNPVPGTFVDTTPQWYAAQADKMLQSGQIDAATHQDLLMYLQLYYGNK